MSDVQEMIEQLRNDVAGYRVERLRGPTNAMLESAEFLEQVADTLERLQSRNTELVAVLKEAIEGKDDVG